MTRWLVRLAILVAIVAGLMAACGFVLRSFVSGSQKDKLVAALSEKMGAPVTVSSVDFDLGQWFRFRPAVTLEGVTVGNPPGFTGKSLFDARGISAQVSLAPLFRKSIELESIRIDEPKIRVETNAAGLTNVSVLLKHASAAGGEGSPGNTTGDAGTPMALAIRELAIRSGTLTLSGPHNMNVRAINVTLRDISVDRRCHLQASADFFDGAHSNLNLDAQAGPFAANSLPLSGKLTLEVAPSEIPAALRREQFGSLLGAPGNKARVSLEATIQGDLYGTLAGPAKLTLADIQIGKDDSHLVPLSGEAQTNLSATNVVASPQVGLDIPSATLRLGKGEWTSSSRVQAHGSTLSGNSRGAIHGVDINQLLGSFTSSGDKISGQLAIPAYSMQFAGKDAADLRNSLHGNAKLSVTEGRLAALDLAATIERALARSQEDTEGTKGSTPFHTLSADLNVAQARMEITNLLLDGPALRANGSGSIGFDHSLRFDLTAHVTGGLARLFNTVSLHPASTEADVPLTVSGTVESPKIRPNIKKVAGGVVQGLVDSFLNRKKK